MSKFINDLILKVIDDSGRGLYELHEAFYYQSSYLQAIVRVEPGFKTDLASIPVALLPLTGGQTGSRAAVVHDWLLEQQLLPREKCDLVFKEALECCGVSEEIRESMYAAVALRTANLKADAERALWPPPPMNA